MEYVSIRESIRMDPLHERKDSSVCYLYRHLVQVNDHEHPRVRAVHLPQRIVHDDAGWEEPMSQGNLSSP